MAAAMDAWLHAVTLRRSDVWKTHLLGRMFPGWAKLARRRRSIAEAVGQKDAQRQNMWGIIPGVSEHELACQMVLCADGL